MTTPVLGILLLAVTAPVLASSKTYYMRETAEGVVEFTDCPDRYDNWTVFIKGGKSRSGSRFRDYMRNFHRYDETIRALGKENNVDPALIKAIVMAESAFNPDALSSTGAQGLMQLIPSTARAVGVADPWDPLENLAGGTRYIKQMLMRFDNDVRLATAAYNAGPRAVERHGGVPPYAETQFYVQRVQSLYDVFRQNDLSFGSR